MPSKKGWDAASVKRRDWSGIAERLGPEQSIAGHMVLRAGSRGGIDRLFGQMTDQEVESLVFDLDFWARREQIPPARAWETCLALAGRGFGKTWMGARWANVKAQEGKTIGALIGPTAADVRDTMIRGSSGILALSPPWFVPTYEPSKRRVTWPNGVYALCYSADKYDRLRGPNTGWVWGDEPATWKHEMAALDQIPLFNRIGTKLCPPQTLLTGTPRPSKKLKELIEKPTTALVTGSSLSNAANLAPTTVANMRALVGTRWGKQEILGLLLLDTPGAIFSQAKWGRVLGDVDPVIYSRNLDRVIVSVDPAPTSETGADETGIMVEGVTSSQLFDPAGVPLKKVSILRDASLRGSPREWATAAIKEYVGFSAVALVVEVNAGGEMVEMTINTVAREMGVNVNIVCVRAQASKTKRAEPVSALAETGRIEFVGRFPKLEKQLESFTGVAGKRDDRCDALVWGVHELVFANQFYCF